MKKKLIQLILLTSYSAIIKTVLVIGDPNAAANTTFSFNVGFVKYDPKTDNSFPRFWTATNDTSIASMPDETKQYGLSTIVQTPPYLYPNEQSIATPMVNSEPATIYQSNGTQVSFTTEPNPIWGNAFELFDVITQKPIFVINGQPSRLYSIHNIERYLTTTTKPNVTDLLRYDFGVGEQIGAIHGFMDSVYTAYSTGAFGSGASNLALIERKQTTDAQGNVQPYLGLLASAPLTTSSEILTGGVGQPALTSFGPQISINTIMRRVYFATQATANPAGVAVAIGQILISSVNNVYSMLFAPVAPESLLASATTFDTVVSAASNNSIRITQTTGMLTSTNLPYMIIARDNGTGPQTVYALPLMNTGDYSGMIADFSSVTTNFGSYKPIFLNRYFTNVLSDISQISLSNPAVQNQITVGGTLPLAAGDNIEQLYSVGDSVYVTIANQYTSNTAPGTYRSQAIFASDGHIISWTPWTRVLGSDKQMLYSFVDYKALTGLYVAAVTPSITPAFKSIYQTTFTSTSNLATFLTAAPGYSGIQGIFDFNQKTPGFNNALSMMIATGFQKVTFGQTGSNALSGSGIFEAITVTSSDVISFSDNVISKQTSIIGAEIAHDSNNNHYIFASGASGVCVYTNDTTGVTWSGTLTGISQLNIGQTWKQVGKFSFVKKLIWDTNYIYILTSRAIYRITLDPNKFTAEPTANLNVETFLEATTINSSTYFLDLIIDNGYCLLGTTQGLYQIAGNIQKIDLPGGLPAVSQLSIISPSINLNGQRSFQALSNLYVLNSTFGTQQAKIYRFLIKNGALTLLPDSVVSVPGNLTQGKPAPFIIFDNYISSYFTDGSWNIAESYFLGPDQPGNNLDDFENSQSTRNRLMTPFVLQINSTVRSGVSSSQVIMPMLTSQIMLPFISFGSNINNMVRETTSGALIASGEFQAHANA